MVTPSEASAKELWTIRDPFAVAGAGSGPQAPGKAHRIDAAVPGVGCSRSLRAMRTRPERRLDRDGGIRASFRDHGVSSTWADVERERA